jgi:MbtH protein
MISIAKAFRILVRDVIWEGTSMQDDAAAFEPVRDLYIVVRNHEEQYSIWRNDKTIPSGWTGVGPPAAKQECLAQIEALWVDMRPASLREQS